MKPGGVGNMVRTFLDWLARAQNRDIEGTALSFVVCQITLAIAASADASIATSAASTLLFLPTVLLAGFFLRFIDGLPVLATAFVATWYFLVPPNSSFALSEAGAFQLAAFVFASGAIFLGTVGTRRLLKRHARALPGAPP
jgi:K+-sensing histidine kinase KdpD